MKKTSTKIIAALLSFVFMFAGVFALFVNAEDNHYRYTDTSPIISTTDSFEYLFSSAEIDRILYDYAVISSEDSNYVILAFEIKIGVNSYQASAEGYIESFTLVSEEILLEGAIDGIMSVNGDNYKITVGFAKLNHSEDAMINVTFTDTNNSIIAFSFGENIIQGEVLDFLLERINGSDSNTTDESLSVEDLSSLQSDNEDTYEPNAPIFIPSQDIFDGGSEGYLNIGENGEYVYQSVGYAGWERTTYKAFESRVYLYKAKGDLLLTLRPCISETNDFIDTLGHDSSYASLHSISVDLNLDSDVDAEKFAGIFEIVFPEYNNLAINNQSFLYGVELVKALLTDYLSLKGIPLETVNTLISGMGLFGAIVSGKHSGFNANIKVKTFLNSELIEQISSGLAIHFYLIKLNPDVYVGGTPYTLNCSAKYFVFIHDINPFIGQSLVFYYIEKNYSHSGTLDL